LGLFALQDRTNAFGLRSCSKCVAGREATSPVVAGGEGPKAGPERAADGLEGRKVAEPTPPRGEPPQTDFPTISLCLSGRAEKIGPSHNLSLSPRVASTGPISTCLPAGPNRSGTIRPLGQRKAPVERAAGACSFRLTLTAASGIVFCGARSEGLLTCGRQAPSNHARDRPPSCHGAGSRKETPRIEPRRRSSIVRKGSLSARRECATITSRAHRFTTSLK